MTLLNLFKFRAADPVCYRDDYRLSADDAWRIAKAIAIAQVVERAAMVKYAIGANYAADFLKDADELLKEGR